MKYNKIFKVIPLYRIKSWYAKQCTEVPYHQRSTHKLFSGVPRNFIRGGSTNSVEDRENGDMGAVAPQSGVLEAAVIWYKKFHFI
jgi:hypothetical protein